jgi:hypothetical protein
MFPKQRQRVIVIAAVLLGTLAIQLVYKPLTAADGSPGIVLVHDGAAGSLHAALLVVPAAIPALLLGMVASATGNPLCGAFVMSAILTTLAWRGGSIDGWLLRTDVPGSYGQLAIEAVVWLALWLGALVVLGRTRTALAKAWPRLDKRDHLGLDTRLGLPGSSDLLAGLVCAVVGGVMAFVLLRASDRGQVLTGLTLAFMLGGLAGQMAVPQHNPIAMLLAPFAVALAAYGWVLLHYPSGNALSLLRAWHSGDLAGTALALPIHYASAGVMGVALGIGWAQGLHGTENLSTASPTVAKASRGT